MTAFQTITFVLKYLLDLLFGTFSMLILAGCLTVVSLIVSRIWHFETWPYTVLVTTTETKLCTETSKYLLVYTSANARYELRVSREVRHLLSHNNPVKKALKHAYDKALNTMVKLVYKYENIDIDAIFEEKRGGMA